MRKGTKVGQAYVALSVDGSGINEDIEDSLDGVDGEKAGEKTGEDYGEGFSARFQKKLRDILQGGGVSQRLDKDIKDAGSSGGDKFGKNFGEAASAQIEDHLKVLLDNLETNIDKVSRNSGGRGGGGGGRGRTIYPPPDPDDAFWAMVNRMNDQVTARRKTSELRAQAVINRDFIKKGEGILKFWDDVAKERYKNETRLSKQTEKTAADLVKQQKRDNDNLWKVRNATAKAHYKFLSDLEKGRVDEEGRNIRLTNGLLGRRRSLGSRVGGFFGGDSRIGPLRIFGKSIGGLTSVFEGVFKAGAKIPGLLSRFTTGFTQAGESASFFQKIGAGFSETGLSAGKLLSSLAASGPAAVIAILAIAAALGVMATVLSAVIALVTAFAATLVSAAVGALAVFGGAILAVVAAAGLLIAAFTQMSDAQKKLLSSAFAPVTEEFRRIGRLVLQDLVPAFATWGKNITAVLVLLEPLARIMGGAFADAGNIFTKALSGPGYKLFIAALGTYLPGIVRNLATAFGGFLNGVLALFAAIMPQVSRFAQYLADTGQAFSNFASSANGQNSIKDFVDRAVTSLLSLWNAVRQVFGFIGDVLFSPQAQEAGNTIFDGIARTFREFRDAVAEAAANGDLKRWFDEAVKFGSAFWELIKSLGGTFKELYNSGFIDLIAASLEYTAFVLDKLNPLIGLLSGGLIGLASDFGGLTNPIDGAIDLANDFIDVLNTILGLLDRIKGFKFPKFKIPHIPGFGGDGVAKAGAYATKPGVVPDSLKPPKFQLGQGDPKAGQYGYENIDFTPGGSGGGGGGGGRGGGRPRVNTAKVLRGILKDVRQAMRDIAKAASAKDARQGLNTLIKSMEDATKGLSKAAKRRVRAAEELIKAQKKFNKARALDLLDGGKIPKGTTLTELAYARENVAKRLDAANKQLSDAISLRDDYKKSVESAIRTFGDLTTASAKSIDGVEQALTATDITTNLQDRLDKIRKFQENLRILIASGLSNSAYKQIVDQGVEGGSAFAQALVNGGVGAVSNVNSLVSQIDSVAAALGTQTSDRLYQAGVNAAQGLVDGLTSLSSQLDAAATRLGNSIALAVKRALGIKSPSTVMIEAMGYVGDGLEKGLDNQGVQVTRAAARLSSRIAVSPEVAAYGSARGGSPVSGNRELPPIHLEVHTPTEDPKAVAIEAVNELVGRL